MAMPSTTAVTVAPLAPVAVNVKLVVVLRTPVETLPFSASAPNPLMVTDVEFAVVQLKVEVPPAAMESGLPLNMMICGRTPAAVWTVTTAVAVTVPPIIPVPIAMRLFAPAPVEMAKGKTLEEALKITRADVASSLGGLPPVKMHCSNLASDALHAAIKDYYKKQEAATEVKK